ncbi:antitoxin family protein [Trichocoleus sp. FACHB-591]|uniref:antitoxin family protein n=1 Tax=Trichocoleus sp. FACHB-591 TaxID=2692872 RepID=UPI0016823CD8|nr:antitoxin family protein [Trichocoleus sp. FACHB-591]MBD2094898.1 antitoxin family protein [Trichocoleus sp. FACHB-591]
MKTITAIYEKGVLRLTQPIDLLEGTEVQVIVMTNEVSFPKGNAASILAAIAALPNETVDSEVIVAVDES